MEGDAGNYNEKVLEKGKEVVHYQDERQKKQQVDKEKLDLQQNCWDLVYEAQALVDQTKTQKERNQEEDEQDRHLDIWEDLLSMKLLTRRLLQLTEHYLVDAKRTKKK